MRLMDKMLEIAGEMLDGKRKVCPCREGDYYLITKIDKDGQENYCGICGRTIKDNELKGAKNVQ